MPSSLPPVLRAFCFATIFFCTAMFVSEVVAVRYWHLDRLPYNRMTLAEIDDCADIAMFEARFQHFHTDSFFDPDWGSDYLYPAPLALVYRFFYYFSPVANWFLGAASFLFASAGVLLFLALRRHGLSCLWAAVLATVSLGFSYPMYFALNRANMEIFVWMLSGLGVLFFLKDRPWLAATFLGIAGACKFYPFCYLGLLLFRKQYRHIVFSVLLGVALNLISMWAVTGDFATGREGISDGLEEFRQTYVLHRRYLEIGLDHSVFGLMKKLMQHVPPPEQLAHLLTIYLVVAAALALSVFFIRVRTLPVTNQLLFLTVVCIALPPLSSDYTLLHLYTPWIMLMLLAVEAWKDKRNTPRGLWPITACMAILLSSQTEIILHGERLNGQIKCVALLILGALAAVIPLTTHASQPEVQPA